MVVPLGNSSLLDCVLQTISAISLILSTIGLASFPNFAITTPASPINPQNLSKSETFLCNSDCILSKRLNNLCLCSAVNNSLRLILSLNSLINFCTLSKSPVVNSYENVLLNIVLYLFLSSVMVFFVIIFSNSVLTFEMKSLILFILESNCSSNSSLLTLNPLLDKYASSNVKKSM